MDTDKSFPKTLHQDGRRVILDYDRIAESYSAVCPELPGCASAGESESEARQNIEEAIRLYVAPSDVEDSL